jgi:hypothetical protein
VLLPFLALGDENVLPEEREHSVVSNGLREAGAMERDFLDMDRMSANLHNGESPHLDSNWVREDQIGRHAGVTCNLKVAILSDTLFQDTSRPLTVLMTSQPLSANAFQTTRRFPSASHAAQ